MINKNDIVAIVLAGGGSSRMGSDKALLNLKGATFLDQVYRAVKDEVSEVIISSNNSLHEIEGVRRIEDLVQNTGPLMGIYSCMEVSTSKFFLVLSCDSPLIKKELINFLVQNHDETFDGSLLKDGDQNYPLIGIYNQGAMISLKSYLDSGKRSVFGFLENLKVQSVEVPGEFQPQIRNFNRPEDLKYLEKHV